MTKILFIAFFTVAVVSGVRAQDVAKKKAGWGVKTGLNFSNLRIENGVNSEGKTGLVFGTFFRIRTGKMFQLQPEFLYSSMGGEVNDGNGTGKVRLNYFSIAPLARYQWNNKLAFVAGPQVDMLIQAKRKSGANQISKVTANYKEASFNVSGGAEYWPSHCCGISARYIYGINNVNAAGSMEMKNQGVQLTAAVKF
jgi:hypothetical protein